MVTFLATQQIPMNHWLDRSGVKAGAYGRTWVATRSTVTLSQLVHQLRPASQDNDVTRDPFFACGLLMVQLSLCRAALIPMSYIRMVPPIAMLVQDRFQTPV